MLQTEKDRENSRKCGQHGVIQFCILGNVLIYFLIENYKD